MRIIQKKCIRTMDIIFSLIAIILITPFMVPIVIGLILTGEHHVFYRQERIGRKGKAFYLLKFATMLENSLNMPGGSHTLKDDPRLLPMGKFLRKTKINELPQLINILKGDMSIIGYRPIGDVAYDHWPEWAKKELYDLRPGLSGIGSIVFRDEEEILQKVDDVDSFYRNTIIPYKMKLECWYNRNVSISLYWKLIWLTIDAIVGRTTWKEEFDDLPDLPAELKKYI